MTAAGQLEFGGMPVRLHSCTPTALNLWLDCPRRYRFTYVDRPTPMKRGPWAHNSLGSAVHLALRDWWDLPFEQRVPEAARRLVTSSWIDVGWRDADQQALWREQAISWVTEYLSNVDPADEPIGIERTVAVRTETLALSGRIDRLDEREDGLAVVDYKTGRQVPDVDEVRASLALAVYAAASARTLRKPCTRVELHHLPSGTISGWDHTPESLNRHLDRAAGIAEEIVAARSALEDGGDPDQLFPVRTSRGCGWCDFRPSCPEGKQASGELEPWAALREDD